MNARSWNMRKPSFATRDHVGVERARVDTHRRLLPEQLAARREGRGAARPLRSPSAPGAPDGAPDGRPPSGSGPTRRGGHGSSRFRDDCDSPRPRPTSVSLARQRPVNDEAPRVGEDGSKHALGRFSLETPVEHRHEIRRDEMHPSVSCVGRRRHRGGVGRPHRGGAAHLGQELGRSLSSLREDLRRPLPVKPRRRKCPRNRDAAAAAGRPDRRRALRRGASSRCPRARRHAGSPPGPHVPGWLDCLGSDPHGGGWGQRARRSSPHVQPFVRFSVVLRAYATSRASDSPRRYRRLFVWAISPRRS